MNLSKMRPDPRGPSRRIIAIEQGSGPTMLTKECGHRTPYANHFTYRLGDTVNCFTCGEAELAEWKKQQGEST